MSQEGAQDYVESNNETVAGMRAAVIREHGGYDKVRVESVPRPSVEAPDDVVVRVRACALNRLDLFARQGVSGPGVRAVRLPHISGVDVAGEIAEVGPEVKEWRSGDRVVLYPGLSCGRCEPCARGEDTMCREYRIFGEDTHGGLAEYCRIRAKNLESLPDHVPFEQGAALPTAYTTAWRMAITVGELRPQERVLVLGASGGVGAAAVQIARRVGAYVFGVASGEDRVQQLRGIGANRPIDRSSEDFESVVAEETDGLGVDMVINPVGGATWRPAVRSLVVGGRMLICGATIGDNPEMSIREIYQSHRQVLGAPLGNRRDFRAVLDLLSRGELQPVFRDTMPLEEISEAHRLIDEGVAFGKVVLMP
ncbi:MAG: Alcohol dehydrogenase [uncultured Rubrobacteraceae bacterium]|uniref:Alcohol dehydrogenase n=1 Tax=uncultured Rubrobacteraceae bacterium TaxID=349277 RepID=A0A6J4QUX1_9ACTN|nr:MAG: Alcohol dehydrogenase [uncultured Rubrobacteraceae bacterium]